MKPPASQSEFAKRVHRSQTALRKRLTRLGLPLRGPWTVAQFREVEQSFLESADPVAQAAAAEKAVQGLPADVLRLERPADTPSQADRLLKYERSKLLAMRYRKERGELIDRKAEEDRDTANYSMLRKELMALPRQLAARMVGRSEIEAEDLLDDAIRRLLGSWSGTDPNTGEPIKKSNPRPRAGRK